MEYVRIKMDTNSKNLIGLTYGFLTVLSKTDNRSSNGSIIWECKCSCGNLKLVSGKHLKSGSIKSCGCKMYVCRRIDMAGQRFGNLTVISLNDGKNEFGQLIWKCQCDCGNIRYVPAGTLRAGDAKTCGVYENHCMAGKKYNRLYKIWLGMIDRCYNASRNNYKNYGARGIKVCDEWLNNFILFRDWSLKNGYSENLTIDRHPDKNGNYSTENCRWADTFQQANNRRTNHFLNFNGQEKTIKEWSVIVGINEFAICQRIIKLKWSTEDALTKPLRRTKIK